MCIPIAAASRQKNEGKGAPRLPIRAMLNTAYLQLSTGNDVVYRIWSVTNALH